MAQAATAIFPGVSHAEAVRRLQHGVSERLVGQLGLDQIQLCPQNHGVLSPVTLEELQELSPPTQYRIHANVGIEGFSRARWDASHFGPDTLPYFTALADLTHRMGAPVYSLHAGYRCQTNLVGLFDNLRRLQDLFGDALVAVEPLYPAKVDYLLSNWDEHESLLASGLPFALDLSHLKIVAARCRSREDDLVAAMLASPQCVEVHVSDNDGYVDRHLPLDEEPPWWWRLLQEAEAKGARFVVFSEGNQVLARRLRHRASQDELMGRRRTRDGNSTSGTPADGWQDRLSGSQWPSEGKLQLPEGQRRTR